MEKVRDVSLGLRQTRKTRNFGIHEAHSLDINITMKSYEKNTVTIEKRIQQKIEIMNDNKIHKEKYRLMNKLKSLFSFVE